MANFDITPLDSKPVSIKPDGSVRIIFTVKNTTGHDVTARAKVQVKETTEDSWLKLSDKTQSFAADETQQYAVDITVPGNSELGERAFSLIVYNVEKPNEEFFESDPVAFEVVGVPEPTRSFPWWIVIAGAAALFLIAGTVLFFVWPRTVKVPDVVGQTRSNAETMLRDKGLTVGLVQIHETMELDPNRVFSQDPNVLDGPVKKGTSVSLTVTQAPALTEVPPVVNKDLDAAMRQLQEAGLKPIRGEEKITGTMKADFVLVQNPPRDTLVKPGSEVILTVEGASVKVPDNLKGKGPDQASLLLSQANLTLGEIKVLPVTTEKPDDILTVFSHTPKANERVPEFTAVQLVVQRKPKPRVAVVGGRTAVSAMNMKLLSVRGITVLKSPPTQISPKNNTRYHTSSRRTLLKWTAVSGAKSYTVEIQHSSSGKWIKLRTASVPGTSFSFKFVGPRPGRWRVRSVDKNNLVSQFSAWWGFSHSR